MMNNRTEKIKALEKVFSTGNKVYLEGTNKMVIDTIIIEKDGWYQIVKIEPTFEVPEKELTLKEYQEFISSVPLFPDLHNDIRK